MTITEPDENVQNVSGLNQLYRIPTVQRTNARRKNISPNEMEWNLLLWSQTYWEQLLYSYSRFLTSNEDVISGNYENVAITRLELPNLWVGLLYTCSTQPIRNLFQCLNICIKSFSFLYLLLMTAFIFKYSMQMIQDIIQYVDKENEEGIIDQQKAFDRVEWGLVDFVLKTFNFGEKHRGWIQMLVKNVTTSIKTNGLMFQNISPYLTHVDRGVPSHR